MLDMTLKSDETISEGELTMWSETWIALKFEKMSGDNVLVDVYLVL